MPSLLSGWSKKECCNVSDLSQFFMLCGRSDLLQLLNPAEISSCVKENINYVHTWDAWKTGSTYGKGPIPLYDSVGTHCDIQCSIKLE